MISKRKELVVGLLFLGDALVTIAAFFVAYYVRFSMRLIPGIGYVPAFWKYAIQALLILPVWFVAMRSAGLYSPFRGVSMAMESVRIVRATTLGTALLLVTSFFLRPTEEQLSRPVIAIFWALDSFALIGYRAFVRSLLERLHRRPGGQRPVLIIGAGSLARRLVRKLRQHSWLGLDPIGYIGTVETADPGDIPCLGPLDQVGDLVRSHPGSEVFITLPLRDYAAIEPVLAQLRECTATVKWVPDIFQFDTLINSGIEDFDGLPVINLVETPLHGWNRVWKRLLDIVVATLAIVLLSPVLVVVAIAIKVTSPGSLIFKQERVGLDGKPFTIFKFRTMVPQGEEGRKRVWGRAADKPVTPIGGFLRRTSIDELPQFFNVLRGHMSVVGPRPEQTQFIDELRRRIPRYMLRHTVKAGITGWAQVNGWRGDTDLEKRIECDLEYVENWSLGLDLKIIWLTVFRSFDRGNVR